MGLEEHRPSCTLSQSIAEKGFVSIVQEQNHKREHQQWNL